MNVRNGWPDGDWSHEQDGCDVVEEGGHQYCVDAENIDEHPYPPSHHLEELNNNNAWLKYISTWHIKWLLSKYLFYYNIKMKPSLSVCLPIKKFYQTDCTETFERIWLIYPAVKFSCVQMFRFDQRFKMAAI